LALRLEPNLFYTYSMVPHLYIFCMTNMIGYFLFMFVAL
jgi:hypothetical protein